MKKMLFALVGIAAAAYGAKKFFLDKEEQITEPYATTEYNSNRYAAPQSPPTSPTPQWPQTTDEQAA